MNEASVRLLQQAHQHYRTGAFAQAQTLYRAVLEQVPLQPDALQSLAAIALQQQQRDVAESYLTQLVNGYPAEPGYVGNLTNLLMQRGAVDEAIACYQRLLTLDTDPAVSHFNFALLLRRAQRNDQALLHYERALAAGISEPEEVYSNISVVYGEQQQHEQSQRALEQALACNGQYIPALYNLALLHEECGRWSQARELLEQIISVDPSYAEAYVRLAQGEHARTADAKLVPQLEALLKTTGSSPVAQESLHYALGKCADDLGSYETALKHYTAANQLSVRRVGRYDRVAQEQQVERLIEWADAQPSQAKPASSLAPIFICGMYRSGSTLLEQMLAGHDALQAGGELTYLQQHWPLAVLTDSIAPLPTARISALIDGYQAELARLFPTNEPQQVINKQPINLFHVPLICRAYPMPRILVTARDPLDNALAVYFQQLSDAYPYANALTDIGQYYLQSQRALAAWQQRFPNNLHTVSYESLVTAPRETLTAALAFLGLPWSENCLAFAQRTNRVRTASVWQVRQPLHQGSVNRADHYRSALDPLVAQLGAASS